MQYLDEKRFLKESRWTARPASSRTRIFQRLLAGLGPTGNGVVCVTPRFFAVAFATAWRAEPPGSSPGEEYPQCGLCGSAGAGSGRSMGRAGKPGRTAILVRASYNRSLKKDFAVLAIYNPLTIGLAAAIIVPAMQRAHAVPRRHRVAPADRRASLVPINLRHPVGRRQPLLSAGTTTTTATYDDLVGPGKARNRRSPSGPARTTGRSFLSGASRSRCAPAMAACSPIRPRRGRRSSRMRRTRWRRRRWFPATPVPVPDTSRF